MVESLRDYPAAPGKCSSLECFYYLRLSTSLPLHQLNMARKTENWNQMRCNEFFLLTMSVGRLREVIFMFEPGLKVWDHVRFPICNIYKNSLEAVERIQVTSAERRQHQSPSRPSVRVSARSAIPIEWVCCAIRLHRGHSYLTLKIELEIQLKKSLVRQLTSMYEAPSLIPLHTSNRL